MTKSISIGSLILGEGMPKICVPLTGTTAQAVQEEAREAVLAGAELVEWRADFFEHLYDDEKLRDMLSDLSLILGEVPLLFTIRTKKEGGNLEISSEDYADRNLAAAGSGKVSLVDVEVFGEDEKKRNLVKALRERKVLVIASSHDFEKTDDRETLLKRYKQMDATGADILKMAVMPHEFDDVAALMQVTNTMAAQWTDKPLIAMSMGNLGSISRISGENFGSCITFGTVGAASAPGQFPVRELRMMMEALHEKNKE